MELPPGPYQLKTSHRIRRTLLSLALFLIGVGAAGGYAIWQLGEARQLWSEGAIWSDPEAVSAPASVHGKVSSSYLLFHSYDLQVSFEGGAGQSAGRTEFSMLLTKANTEREPFVRFLPGQPGRYVLSWAREAKASRWAALLFVLVLGVGLIGGSFSLLGWRSYAALREEEAAAARGSPVWCRVTSVDEVVVKGRSTGERRYTYAVDLATLKKVTSSKAHGEPQLRQGPRGPELLAILARSGEVLVPLGPGLHPLALPDGGGAGQRAAPQR
jgi:hypothetical protein